MTRAIGRGGARRDDDPRVPAVDVTVGGRPLAPEGPADVMSVTLLEDVDALSMITLVLRNWDARALAYLWSDSPRMTVGAEVRVTVGYVDDARRRYTQVGEIVALEPAFVVGEVPTLTVRCFDVRHRLTRGVRTRSFARMSDSDIVRRVASAAGLRAQVTTTAPRHEYVLQHNQTDLEFLADRARLIGYELFSRDGALLFRPPASGAGRSVALEVGRDVTAFTPRMRAVSGIDSSTVRGWDAVNKKPLVGTAGTGRPTPTGGGRGAPAGPRAAGRATGGRVVVDVPVRTKDHADRIALARRDEAASAQIEAEADCVGRPDLRAGTVVEIQQAGTAFSGAYYVAAAEHGVTSSTGYQTRLTMRRYTS